MDELAPIIMAVIAAFVTITTALSNKKMAALEAKYNAVVSENKRLAAMYQELDGLYRGLMEEHQSVLKKMAGLHDTF